jgi:predicted MFS family arabinose efflux permease
MSEGGTTARPTGTAWAVLATCWIGLAFGFGSAAYVSFGLFVVPLSQEFGWGRGEISAGFTVMSLAVALLAPVAGSLIDRYGPRRLLLPAIVTFAAVMAAMSLMTANIWHFYAMYLLLPIAAICTGPVSYVRVIVAWFESRRGLALGIGLTGTGFGGVVIPPMVQWITQTWGWRFAYIGIALGILAVLPLAYWLIHDGPRKPGQSASAARAQRAAAPPAPGLTAGEARRGSYFWIMAVSFAIFGLYTAGMTVHLVPLLTDRGLAPEQAAAAASAVGAALIVGRLAAGYLLDHLFAPYIVIAVMLCPVVAMGVLASGAGSLTIAIGCAILIGIGLGAEMDFMGYLISRYFGLKSYAQIYGYIYGVFAFGSALGPILMGFVQQGTGSYEPALWTLTVLTFAALVPFAFFGPYPVFAPSEPQVVAPQTAGTANGQPGVELAPTRSS